MINSNAIIRCPKNRTLENVKIIDTIVAAPFASIKSEALVIYVDVSSHNKFTHPVWVPWECVQFLDTCKDTQRFISLSKEICDG